MRAPVKLSPLVRALCPHCQGDVEPMKLVDLAVLVERHHPGLPVVRQPLPGERHWWCPACLIPGSITPAPRSR